MESLGLFSHLRRLVLVILTILFLHSSKTYILKPRYLCQAWSLTFQQHSQRDFESYSAHMEGLLTIVKLRGGVHKIDHNRILRLLISGYVHPIIPYLTVIQMS